MVDCRISTLALVTFWTLASSGSGQSPYLGIEGADSVDGSGVTISLVVGGTAAERAGLAADDRLVEIDGVATLEFNKLRESVLSRSPGAAVLFVLTRAGETHLKIAVLAVREEPGLRMLPDPESLATVLERLSGKAARAYCEEDWALLAQTARCAGEAGGELVTHSLAIVCEPERTRFAARMAEALRRVEWFDSQTRLGNRVPLRSVRPSRDEEASALVALLDSEDYLERERASEELLEMAQDAESALRAVSRDGSLEASTRARWLLGLLRQRYADPDLCYLGWKPVEAGIARVEGTTGSLEATIGVLVPADLPFEALLVSESGSSPVRVVLGEEGKIEFVGDLALPRIPGGRLVWIEGEARPE